MPFYPAIVQSYDAQKRRARLNIAGLTDGSNVYPEAELLYPMGDAHDDTEIPIEAGDKVYVDFLIDGDWRYPIIVGFRQPETGNLVGIRRFRQKRIEMIADEVLIDCSNLTVTGNAALQKNLTVDKETELKQNLSVTGNMSNNGSNVGSSHVHDEHGDGGGTTSPPR